MQSQLPLPEIITSTGKITTFPPVTRIICGYLVHDFYNWPGVKTPPRQSITKYKTLVMSLNEANQSESSITPSWCSPGIVSPCNARSVAPPSLRVLGSRSQGSKVTPERDETDQRQRRVSRPRIPGPGSDCVTETDRPLLLITAAAPSCVSQGFLLCEESGNRNMKVKIKVVGGPLFQKLLNGQFSELNNEHGTSSD